MEPKDKYQELKLNNFPMFLRGDIVLTNNLDSMLASLIRFRAKLKGKEPYCNHEEMYLMNGNCIGANKKIDIGDLNRFFTGKHEVYIFRDILLTEEERNKLVIEALRKYGKMYDAFGIVWQALDAITFSTFFSKMFNKDFLYYCSEFVQRVYDKAVQRNPSISDVGCGTPNDSFLYKCFSPDFKCVFMMRKNDDGEWIYLE
jgi:hypothetical protein